MSLRIDSTDWISDALVIGNTGLGVLGADIPADGDSGASILYNDVTLPDDAARELCGRVTTWPAAGTLAVAEDGAFTFSGAADGAYYFDYQLYVDGVATGAPARVTLLVGAVSASAAGTLGSVTLVCPTGTAAATASIDTTATGGLAVCALTAPTGAAEVDATASGELPSVWSVPPTGTASVAMIGDVTATGGIFSCALSAPIGIAFGTSSQSGEVTLSAETIATIVDAVADEVMARIASSGIGSGGISLEQYAALMVAILSRSSLTLSELRAAESSGDAVVTEVLTASGSADVPLTWE